MRESRTKKREPERRRVDVVSLATCLFVLLIVEFSGWRLIFTGEFGNEKERGAVRGEIHADGKNAGGAGAALGGVEFINERLRLGGESFFVFGFIRPQYVCIGHRVSASLAGSGGGAARGRERGGHCPPHDGRDEERGEGFGVGLGGERTGVGRGPGEGGAGDIGDGG